MMTQTDVPGNELAQLPRDLCYFSRARLGLAPTEDTCSEHDMAILDENGLGRQVAAAHVRVAADVDQVASESIDLDCIARELPDPSRHFWWFSVTAIPEQRIAAGLPVLATSGSRLPAEADYWFQEGNAEWTKIDHSVRPKPRVKNSKRPSWRYRH